MKNASPWIISAFLVAFFVFQSIGYKSEKQRLDRLDTIEGQTEVLSDWLELDDSQRQGYLDFRMSIVAKEKEFQDYRKKDAQEFWEANKETLTADEKMKLIKERHLKILQETKAEELELWSAWIDTLTFEQRRQYLGKVFQHRPLDASWYDRDFFDDID